MNLPRIDGHLSPLPPVVLGGVLVVPVGLLGTIAGRPPAELRAAIDTQASAARARAIVMEVERGLGYVPVDRELEKLGYDVESVMPGTGRLRFIEVKGRVSGAETITVTKNEILYSFNKPDEFILAIVEFFDGGEHKTHYLRRPFHGKGITTEFSGATVDFPFKRLIAEGAVPS
jgi:hypothetical protein